MSSEFQADLCIVGSGIAGMLLAERALAAGRKVLMIERGTPQTHEDFLKQASHKDPLAFNKSPVRVAQVDDWDYVYRPGYNVGGSTNHFYGNMPRVHPAHFRAEAFAESAARAWPIAYAELEPFYLAAEKRLQISGNSEHKPFPGAFQYPLPPHDLSPSDRACAEIFGPENVTQVPTVRPSQAVDGRPQCCASNRCTLCPIDSKGTSLNMVYPAIRERIDLHSGLLATEIDADSGRVKGVSAVDAKGASVRIQANEYVIACNGVDSVLLLLRSKDIPKHSSLGKHYMDHPEFSIAIYGSGLDARPGYGKSAQTAMITSFYERLSPDLPVSLLGEVKGGELGKEEGSKNRDLVIRDLLRLSMEKKLSSRAGLRERFEEGFRQTIYLHYLLETTPVASNTIGIRKIDGSGAAIPDIRIAYPEYTDRAIEMVVGSIRKRVPKADVRYLGKKLDAQHWMGAARMSNSAADGCVDRDLRYHGLDNLYVLTAATYPSVGSAHPTLTVCALALRLGEHLTRGAAVG